MIKKLLIFALIVQIAGFSIAADSLTYNKSVTLKGKVEIVRSTHPNPTFRGTKQPAIRLSTPVDVIADPEDDMTETEKKLALYNFPLGKRINYIISYYMQMVKQSLFTVLIYFIHIQHITQQKCYVQSIV